MSKSKFQEEAVTAIKDGLNLSGNMYKEEFHLGRFITGWKEPVDCPDMKKGHRYADIKINGQDTIYKVSRPILIEVDGRQHDDPMAKWNDPVYDKTTHQLIWTRAQNFNDQIDRDEWENLWALENHYIMIRIKEPVWMDVNPAYWKQREILMNKLSKPGYLSEIIHKCERSNAKGVIIAWDNEKPVVTKNWPKPKYIY